jgi:hypothetical protein
MITTLALMITAPGGMGQAAAPSLFGRAGARVVDVALAGSVQQVLDNIRNWIIGILAGLATVFLTIGGARYVMAGGDPAEVERARAALRSAAFGYGLAALAPLVVQILKSIVGA